MNDRIKRLIFRANHMGSNENDILFGAFARDHLTDLSPEQLDEFETLLAENDTDLFDWITAKRPAPPELQTPLMEKIIAHVALGKPQS
jgi:antitoxin CptB